MISDVSAPEGLEERQERRERHDEYMARRTAEEKAMKKGTYEYEYGKPSDKQIGGSHYKDYTIQPIHFIMENNLGFCEGNVLKYITRWQDKGGIEDLRKAKHYITMLSESALEKEK